MTHRAETLSRTSALVVALAVALVVACGLDEAAAAPQTFNTALPVAKGEFVFRGQLLYRESSEGSSTADRNLEVLSGVSVLGYGTTGTLAVFGVIPYLDKRLELNDASGRRSARSARGIGDARLFARRTIFKADFAGRTFRVAPFLGLELPTGGDDERDAVGLLPPSLQLGSGSWDPFGGVSATYQTLDYQLDAQLAYKANTEANDFDFGDELRLDASLQYRLLPRELGAGVPGFLYGVIEANLVRLAKNEESGFDDPDSGGTTLFVSPGLQYVTKRWILEGIVQLPVVQDLNGTALEEDFIVRAGFRLNF